MNSARDVIVVAPHEICRIAIGRIVLEAVRRRRAKERIELNVVGVDPGLDLDDEAFK